MAVARERAFDWPAHDTTRVMGQTADGVMRRSRSLVRAIEAEVIPRLVLARHATHATAPLSINAVAPTRSDVLGLSAILLSEDSAAAWAFVDRMHDHGASLEALYLDLLAPAARWLGEMWCQDTCDFADVTMGLSKLHRLLYEFGPQFRAEREARLETPRILLVPAPGEQHSFGLMMVAEFFRRAAWDVWDEPAIPAHSDLVRLVRAERFDMVGLSIASETHVDGITRGIQALRRASRQHACGVLVGGPLIVRFPDLVAQVGADTTAVDGGQAPVQAESLLRLLAGRP